MSMCVIAMLADCDFDEGSLDNEIPISQYHYMLVFSQTQLSSSS